MHKYRVFTDLSPSNHQNVFRNLDGLIAMPFSHHWSFTSVTDTQKQQQKRASLPSAGVRAPPSSPWW